MVPRDVRDQIPESACVADLRSCVAGRGAAASTASWRRRGWRGVCQRHSGQPAACMQQRQRSYEPGLPSHTPPATRVTP